MLQHTRDDVGGPFGLQIREPHHARLEACERQAVRADRTLRAGRATAFAAVYGLALAVFSVSRFTVALLVVAVGCAALCLVLAAVIADAAVVVVLAALAGVVAAWRPSRRAGRLDILTAIASS